MTKIATEMRRSFSELVAIKPLVSVIRTITIALNIKKNVFKMKKDKYILGSASGLKNFSLNI